MLETSPPAVVAVVEFLKTLHTPKAPRLLAVEAKKYPLALSLAVKLTPMASAAERQQLHRLLMAAYPALAERPSLEEQWRTSGTDPSRTGAVLQTFLQTILGEDGTLNEQALRQVSEALGVDLLPAVLDRLATIVGTEHEPRLAVKEIRMAPGAVPSYGCLWIFEGCHYVRQKQMALGVKAFQQALGHRRYAAWTGLIAGQSLLRSGDKTVYKQAEAVLLNGERAAMRNERPGLLEALVTLYRTTGQADAMARWQKELSQGASTPAAPVPTAAPTVHLLKDLAPYPALFPDAPPIVLQSQGSDALPADEWIVSDAHCADPRCSCDKVWFRVEAAHHDCRGTFELNLRSGQLTATAGEPVCEHASAILTGLMPAMAGPNEAVFLRQRTKDVKALARAGRWDLQQRLKAAEHLLGLDAELKALLQHEETVLVPLADWLALLRSTEVDMSTETRGWQRILRARGFGMEPDPLTGAAQTPVPEGLVLFRLPSRAQDYIPRGAVWTALVMVRLGMAMAHELALETEDFSVRLAAAGESLPGLGPEDRMRVKATAVLHRRYRPSSRTATRGLDQLGAGEKAEVAARLVEALHDHATRPDVVRRLGKLYALLGLDPHTVFGALHAAGTVTARSGEALDLTLVQARLQETRKVESLLETIFAEEAAVVPTQSHGHLPDVQRLFLERLLGQDTWSRAEVVDVAASLELLVDGAIDTINDASLERFDELALEGDDPMYVNREIAAQLI